MSHSHSSHISPTRLFCATARIVDRASAAPTAAGVRRGRVCRCGSHRRRRSHRGSTTPPHPPPYPPPSWGSHQGSLTSPPPPPEPPPLLVHTLLTPLVTLTRTPPLTPPPPLAGRVQAGAQGGCVRDYQTSGGDRRVRCRDAKARRGDESKNVNREGGGAQLGGSCIGASLWKSPL